MERDGLYHDARKTISRLEGGGLSDRSADKQVWYHVVPGHGIQSAASSHPRWESHGGGRKGRKRARGSGFVGTRMTRVPRIRRLNRARIRVTVDESRASPWTEAGKYSLRLAIRRVSLPRNRSLRHPVKFRGSRDLERILLFSLGVPLRRDSVLIETICMDICITDSIMNFKYVEKRSISDDQLSRYSLQFAKKKFRVSRINENLIFGRNFIYTWITYRIYIWNNEKCSLYVAYIIPILLLIVHTDMEKIVVVDREWKLLRPRGGSSAPRPLPLIALTRASVIRLSALRKRDVCKLT